MSQLLNRIERALESTTDRFLHGKLCAKKAIYLTRVGQFLGARELVSMLRAEFGEVRSGPVTPWIMLVEGLLHYYESLSVEALDRVTRSQILALSLGDFELAALASAWKAHIEFERSKFDAMQRSLQTALSRSDESNYAARTRIAMVLCDATLLCGNLEEGQKWFMRGRDFALKEGDQASIEGLLYNRAAFNFAWLRAQRCFGPISPDRISLVKMEIASAKNLQNMTGVMALKHIVYVCEARLMIIEESFAEAIRILESLRFAGPYGEYNFNPSLLDLEIAYCNYRLGENSRSSPYLLQGWRKEFDTLDIDDQLCAAWMISEILAASEDSLELSRNRERFCELKEKYLRMIADLRLLLEVFSPDSLN